MRVFACYSLHADIQTLYVQLATFFIPEMIKMVIANGYFILLLKYSHNKNALHANAWKPPL